MEILPPILKGMKVLERSAFGVKLKVWALQVPAKSCHTLLSTLSQSILKIPKVKTVVKGEKDPLILLSTPVTLPQGIFYLFIFLSQ